MNVQQKSKGFTIIEVVLVLAIAGLIFLMVFIALPALQRSQRDATRKTEVGTVVAAIQGYMSNNRNQIPTAAQITEYIAGTGSLESGAKIYRITAAYSKAVSPVASITSGTPDTANATLYQDQIKVWFGYKCATTGTALVRGTSKQAAVVTVLESGPAIGTLYCRNN